MKALVFLAWAILFQSSAIAQGSHNEQGLAATVSSAPHQTQILVLYSTRRDAQIAVIGERELPQILDRGLKTRLDYYSEFVDSARFPEPEYRAALRDFLFLKYRGITFDAVFAMGDIAVDFLAQSREDLFVGAPVIFFSSTRSERPFANATGFWSPANFTGTIELAARLQPGLLHVFVVTGAGSDDKAIEAVVRTQLRAYESRFRIEYLSGLATSALDARLSRLPSNSLVYYTAVKRDGAGHVFHPLEYLDHVSAVSNAPVYTWVDSGLGHGVVGGDVKVQQAQVDQMGEIALRVLHGESADSLPIITRNLNVKQVDWRQLKRWSISESLLPEGTKVLFREPTAWDRYKDYILAVTLLFAAETALIVTLLVQRRRRRQAEQQLRGSEAQLRSSYERIRDLGGRLLTAQETERARIARELHDDISQQIALLAIDLELLKRPATRHVDTLSTAALTRAESIARSVHDLSHRLHPARLRLIGLVNALEGLKQELARQDVDIVFSHEHVPSTLSADLTLCVYRVVQEALQNAVKYSGARRISVSLRGGPDALGVSIADDGRGFDVARAWGQGLGLISMRERLEALGGTFHVLSSPGGGTRIDITLPIEAPADAPAAV